MGCFSRKNIFLCADARSEQCCTFWMDAIRSKVNLYAREEQALYGFLLLFISGAHEQGKLIGARGALAAAVDASEQMLDLSDGHALTGAAEGL